MVVVVGGFIELQIGLSLAILPSLNHHTLEQLFLEALAAISSKTLIFAYNWNYMFIHLFFLWGFLRVSKIFKVIYL